MDPQDQQYLPQLDWDIAEGVSNVLNYNDVVQVDKIMSDTLKDGGALQFVAEHAGHKLYARYRNKKLIISMM